MLIQVPKLAHMPVRCIYISIKIMASAFHQLLWQVSLNKNRSKEVRILTQPCRVNSNRAETKKERQTARAQAESLAPVKSGALFSQTHSIETWLLLVGGETRGSSSFGDCSGQA